jgi:hypothetical protein
MSFELIPQYIVVVESPEGGPPGFFRLSVNKTGLKLNKTGKKHTKMKKKSNF